MRIPITAEIATAGRLAAEHGVTFHFRNKTKPKVTRPDGLDTPLEPVFVDLLLSLCNPAGVDTTNPIQHLRIKSMPERLHELGIISDHERMVLVNGRERLTVEVEAILGRRGTL